MDILEKFSYFNTKICVIIRIAPLRLSNESHTIILQKIEKTSTYYFHLSPNLVILSASKYLYLEQNSMVPKMLEPLRFDLSYTYFCIYM